MSPDNIITLIAAGFALIASLVATTVSIYNARFHRFTRERWWERKVEAYAEVIGSLVSLTYSLDRWTDDEYEQMTGERYEASPPDVQKAINTEYAEALAHIQRVAIEGNFILSEKAANAISDLIKKNSQENSRELRGQVDMYESLIADFKAAKDCLKILRDEANSDLLG